MNDTPALSTWKNRTTRDPGAGLPLQTAAHLYFIFSGLWLTLREISRRATRRKPREVMAERAELQRRFARYFGLLRRWQMLHVEFEGFEDCHQWRRTVIAPNHPSLMDAVALISRIPGLDCVMNARLLHDPVMGGAARLCGYICNRAPVPMLKACEKRLTTGSNVLFFPEGTRTTTPPLSPFHPGYALAAIRASATIQTVFIECDSLYFGRTFSFFRPAPCPMRFRLTAGKVFHPGPDDDPREVSREVEKYYKDALENHGDGIRRRVG